MAADPDLYSADIEWLLTASDAAIGHRSAMGSFVAALERGTPTTFYDPRNADPYTDDLGYLDPDIGGHVKLEHVRRYRRLWRAWVQLEWHHQRVLAARYLFRMRCQIRNAQGEPEWAPWPPRVESMLGQAAGVAIMLAVDADALSALLKACETRNDTEVTTAVKEAEAVTRAAHRAFFEASDEAWHRGAA